METCSLLYPTRRFGVADPVNPLADFAEDFKPAYSIGVGQVNIFSPVATRGDVRAFPPYGLTGAIPSVRPDRLRGATPFLGNGQLWGTACATKAITLRRIGIQSLMSDVSTVVISVSCNLASARFARPQMPAGMECKKSGLQTKSIITSHKRRNYVQAICVTKIRSCRNGFCACFTSCSGGDARYAIRVRYAFRGE